MALALLPGLAACGKAGTQPAEEPATAAAMDWLVAGGTREDIAAAFEPAIELYGYFTHGTMRYDSKGAYEYNGRMYYRVADPRYPTLAALGAALRELFSEELARKYLNRSAAYGMTVLTDPTPSQAKLHEIWRREAEKCPLYLEFEGKLYSCMDQRGTDVTAYRVSVENESDRLITYKVIAVGSAGDEKEGLFARERIEGKWVFTEFPLDWQEPGQAPAAAGEPAMAAPAKAAFERGFELYKYFTVLSMRVDYQDAHEQGGVTYYRVADPEYPSMEALSLALREVFSPEIAHDFLGRTVQSTQPWNTMLDPGLAQARVYVENDGGKLYTCMGDRGTQIASYSVGAESESENKIVSRLSAVNVNGGTEETLLTQELIGGKWVFTEFPLDW